MFKINKKGFAISFSWLFSIIAGMSVFLFLVWFSVQQTDLFGNLTAKIAVEELDIAFTGFKSNLVGSRLDFGKEIELEFKCDSSTLNEERMFINGIAGKKLKGNIVFAPSSMESNEFRLFTASWNVPFRVTNFIFLNSNKDLLYLNNHMPSGLGGIPDIFDDGNSLNAEDPRDYIERGTGPCPLNGKKVYYEIDQNTREAFGTICINGVLKPFYGTAFVYAVIFADENNFICIYENALEKANIMKTIYLEKFDNIENCGISNIERVDIKTTLENLDVRSQSSIEDLQEKNNNLLRKGCEAIY